MLTTLRGLAIAAALLACKKESPKETPRPTPVALSDGGAAMMNVDGAAAPALVDLFRAVPCSVRVSSQVKNPSILPEHLVDQSLQTAWNSRTNDLVGAWIEVTVPAGANVREVRLTVGHTGTGPKGEDYFTMNPRIKEIEIVDPSIDVRLATAKLDLVKRELQTIPVAANGTFRIRVLGIDRGTKKNWREVAISELEVWGTPPPGWVKPGIAPTPTVTVALPPGTSALDALCKDLESDKESRLASIQKSDASCMKLKQPERDQCLTDPPGLPGCAVSPVAVTGIEAPWRDVGSLCEVHDDVYGPTTCEVVIDVDGVLVHGPQAEFSSAHGNLEVTRAALEDVIPGGEDELVLEYETQLGSDITKLVAICHSKPAKCSEPIERGTDPIIDVLAKHPPVFK